MSLRGLFAYMGCCSNDVKDQNAEQLFEAGQKAEENKKQNASIGGASARRQSIAQSERRSGQASLGRSTIKIRGAKSCQIVNQGQGKINLTFMPEKSNGRARASIVMDNNNSRIQVDLQDQPSIQNREEEKEHVPIEEEKKGQAPIKQELDQVRLVEEEKKDHVRQVEEGSAGQVAPAQSQSQNLETPEGPRESRISELVISLEGSSISGRIASHANSRLSSESLQRFQNPNSSQSLSDALVDQLIKEQPKEGQSSNAEANNQSQVNVIEEQKLPQQENLMPNPYREENHPGAIPDLNKDQQQELKGLERSSFAHKLMARNHKQQLYCIQELPQEHSNFNSIDKQHESNQNSSAASSDHELLFEESKEPRVEPKQQPIIQDSRERLDVLLGAFEPNSEPVESDLLDSWGSQKSSKSLPMGSLFHSNQSMRVSKQQARDALMHSSQYKVSNHFNMMKDMNRQVKTPAHSIKLSREELKEYLSQLSGVDQKEIKQSNAKIVKIQGKPELAFVNDSECMSESDMFASNYDGVQSEDQKSNSSQGELGKSQKSWRDSMNKRPDQGKRQVRVPKTPTQENRANQSIKSLQDYMQEEDDGPVSWTLQRQVQQQAEFDAVRGRQSNQTIESHMGVYKGPRLVRHLREKLKQIDQRFSN